MKKVLELTLLLSIATLAVPVLSAPEIEEISENQAAESEAQEQGAPNQGAVPDLDQVPPARRASVSENQNEDGNDVNRGRQSDSDQEQGAPNQDAAQDQPQNALNDGSSFMEYIREFPGGAYAWVMQHKPVVGGTTAVVVATAVAYYAWCKHANNTQEGEKCLECKDEWADFS